MNTNTSLFSHDLLAEKIANIFVQYNKENSFVIAIDGVWGTGKTHLMNNVLEVLNNRDYIKVCFNAWRYSKKEEIWHSLLICILDSCRMYVNDQNNQEYLGWDNNDKQIILNLCCGQAFL